MKRASQRDVNKIVRDSTTQIRIMSKLVEEKVSPKQTRTDSSRSKWLSANPSTLVPRVSGTALRGVWNVRRHSGGLPNRMTPSSLSSATTSAPTGISVFSSYATGIGAVLAIALRIIVRVHIFSHGGQANRKQPVKDSLSYLTECAQRTLASTGNDSRVQFAFEVQSDVPAGRGLKTSAAVGVATCGASAGASESRLDNRELVRLSAAAARVCGLTQAGSLDDSWCAAIGGVVIADEKSQGLIDHWPAPDDLDVIIFVPEARTHGAHFVDRRRLMERYASAFDELSSQLSETRDIMAVMTTASYLTATAFGCEKTLLDLALRAGALGVSLSGKGPAIAALTQGASGKAVAEAWRRFPGRIIQTTTDNFGVRCEDLRSSNRTRHFLEVRS